MRALTLTVVCKHRPVFILSGWFYDFYSIKKLNAQVIQCLNAFFSYFFGLLKTKTEL